MKPAAHAWKAGGLLSVLFLPCALGSAIPGLGELPLRFEVNAGQANPAVNFLWRGPGYTLFLKRTEVVIGGPVSMLRMSLSGGNPNPQMAGLDPLPGTTNYLLGKDPMRWRTRIPSYSRVAYREVYPGVDLIYYGNGQALEYDFVLAPGVDARVIRLAFDGTQELEINSEGSLLLGGGFWLRKPLLYQESACGRRSVEGRWVLGPGKREASFEVGAYDRNQPLVIDPVLEYSTHFGADVAGPPPKIAVNHDGTVYIMTTVASRSLPLGEPWHAGPGGSTDILIAKLNASGSAVVYTTFLGGSAGEIGEAVAIDPAGNVYVTGETHSDDFPTVNALQPARAGYMDGFISKLDPTGSKLVYSTYFGTDGNDYSRGIAADAAGNAYITGSISPLVPERNRWDAVVLKLDSVGRQVYSRVFGGTGASGGDAIAVDPLGQAHIAGRTNSPDFPMVNPLRPLGEVSPFSLKMFVMKLNADGSAPLYSTYLDENGGASLAGIALDAAGDVYVTGVASSSFPTVNAVAPCSEATNSFAAKLNAAGPTLVYSTCLPLNAPPYGGTRASGIAVDAAGNAHIIGFIGSRTLPTVNAIQPTSGDALLFQSTDGGATWRPSDRGLTGSAVWDLVVDPAVPGTVYAAAIEGIYRSADRGETWVRIGSVPGRLIGAIERDAPFRSRSRRPPRLVLYVFADRTLYRSTDRGDTWEADPLPDGILEAMVDPGNPSVLFAAGRGEDRGVVFKTADAGRSWRAVPVGVSSPVERIVVHQRRPSVLYANSAGGLFQSTDGGETWGQIRPPCGLLISGSCEEYLLLAIDPANPSTLYSIGRTRLPSSSPRFRGIYKSMDSGRSWSFLTSEPIRLLLIDPYNTSTLYAVGGVSAGALKSTDGGRTWKVNPLSGTPVSTLVLDPSNPLHLYAGANTPGDAFVLKLNPSGSALDYVSYLGGSGPETAGGIAVDGFGNTYVVGTTYSFDFPVARALQPVFFGRTPNLFITKIGENPRP
jgi:photosystem II stability/assembly factor-like uncharacterized protein